MAIPPLLGQEALMPKYDDLVESLTGATYYGLHPDNLIAKPHKGINVRVTWKDKTTGTTLREKPVVSDNGKSRIRTTIGASFLLDSARLPPGDYVVTVEALRDDERFDGTFKTGVCSGQIFK
jgi:hypothetical protein